MRIATAKTSMEKPFSLSPELSQNILENYFEFLRTCEDQADQFSLAYVAEVKRLNAETLKRLLEAIFQASLVKEESKHHQFSVYVSPPEARFSKLLEPYAQKHFCGYFDNVTSFEDPIEISALPKIAPSFESTNQKLRVWFNSNGEIEIWGFAKSYFDYLGLEVRTFSAGQLLIHTKPLDFPRDRFLLTFSRTEKVVSTFSLVDLLFSEVDLETMRNVKDMNWVRFSHRRQRRHGFLINVINKMSSHGHGGTLLLIPEPHSSSVLSESIKQPIAYKPDGGFDVIRRRLIDEENQHVYSYESGKPNPSLPWDFEKDADFLGQITAIDGATVVTKDFDVLAFGAKIRELEPNGEENTDRPRLQEVWIQQPFEGREDTSKSISDFWGTRHQSAAHFVFDQREKDVFAIVASQDGRVSIISWDKSKNRVNAFTPAEYLYYGLKF
jgi:hypothetical protein